MCNAGLKFNAPKWSFELKYTPYLGYVITWEGIKPDTKIMKGIMDNWSVIGYWVGPLLLVHVAKKVACYIPSGRDV